MKNWFKPTTKKVIWLLSSTTLTLSILLTIVLMKDHTQYYLTLTTTYTPLPEDDELWSFNYPPFSIDSCKKYTDDNIIIIVNRTYLKQKIEFKVIASCQSEYTSRTYYKLKRA